MRAAAEIISWPVLMALTGNRVGVFDVPCPLCSSQRKPANRKKPVLRVWRDERPDFATYCCAHCGATVPFIATARLHDASIPSSARC